MGRPQESGWSRRLLTYVLGILAALTLTVALVVMVMRPPLNDLMYLGMLFALTGSGSALIGYVSHQLGWWRRFRSLSQTLTLGYVIAAALTLLNVWLTARMMFINQHDLTLAGLLLVFAGGISVSFGYFISASITHTLRQMAQAAERISEGDFTTRVSVPGHDEVAQLAQTFNNMAAIGPDFKKRFADAAPIGNADIQPTLAAVLRFKIPSLGALQGRVLTEALAGRYSCPVP